ncbi:MAG: DUF4435 domain-containing protein [Magnetococcales bacterium]|nr:DUF4435 domain-containing protein [Magnetococcales bacterium]
MVTPNYAWAVISLKRKKSKSFITMEKGVGNFATISDIGALGKKYSNRVLLYLESREDVEIFRERWFKDATEWVEFVPVDNPDGGGGGSSEVLKRVQADRENQVAAFGIVDRDVLLNHNAMDGSLNWNAFLEPDHDIFEAARYLGPNIKILRRWEIENYLLHPEAISKLLENMEAKEQVHCSGQTASQCLLGFSEVAILMTAANLVLMDHRKTLLQPLFGQQYPTSDDLKPMILQQLESKDIAASDEIEIKSRAIRAFLKDKMVAPKDQWNQLNHLIDGKLFLERFCVWLGLKDPRRLELAGRIADQGLIDLEISSFMETIKANPT